MRNVGNKIIIFLSLYGLLSFHLFEVSSLKMQFGGGVIFSSAKATEPAAKPQGPEANNRAVPHEMQGTGTLDWEAYLSLLTLLVATLISYSMPFACGKTCGADVWVSVAAATVFLGGEIAAYAGYRRALHSLKTSISATCDYRNPEHNGKKEAGEAGKNACNDPNNTQFEILRKQRDSYAQIRDVATAKAVLQGAAAAGWAAAAVIAFTSAAETPPKTEPAPIAAVAKVGAAASAVTAGSLGFGSANAANAVTVATKFKVDLGLLVIKALLTPNPIAQSAEINYCQLLSSEIIAFTHTMAGLCISFPACPPLIIAAGMEVAGTVLLPDVCSVGNTSAVIKASPPVGAIRDLKDPQYLVENFIKSLLIEDVQAEENNKEKTAGSVGHDLGFWAAIGGGPAALIFWGSKSRMAQLWSGMFVKPVTRGLWYTALFGLATTATVFSALVAVKMQENAKAIDDLLKQSGVDETNVSADGGDINTLTLSLLGSNNRFDEIPFVAGDAVPCPAGKDKNGNCMNPPNLDDPRFGFGKLPGDIRSSAQTMASLARSLGGKKAISKADLKMAAGLSKNAAGIRKRLMEAKNKLNGMLPKNNNLDSALNNLMAGSRAATLKVLKDNNKTPAQALAALGGVQALPDDLKKSFEADFQKADKKSLLDSAGAAVNPETPAFNFDLGNKEQPVAPVVDSAAGDAAIEGLDIKVDDIASNKENIFEMISVRYKKTAYPKLFTELPLQKEAEKTPPKQ